MKWVVYKEVYVSLQRVNHKSGHPENVRRVLDRFTHYCGLIGADLDEVSQHDFDLYVAKRRDDEWRGKPISNRTINNEIDILNATLSKAGPKSATRAGRENYGYLSGNPPYKSPLEEDDPEPVCVGGDTIAAFMQAVQEHAKAPDVEGCTPYEFWLCVLLIGGITGLRRGALLQIPRPETGKRCQEPFEGFFTGLPRGVTVLSRPSCLILRRDQFESPNGQPRFILLCRAVCSLAVMGWLTCLSQPGFLGSGHFESSSFSRGVPECQRYKLLKRQSSARSTRLGGAFWSSHSKTINQAAQNVNLRFLTRMALSKSSRRADWSMTMVENEIKSPSSETELSL